jgi:hypothetical protein
MMVYATWRLTVGHFALPAGDFKVLSGLFASLMEPQQSKQEQGWNQRH